MSFGDFLAFSDFVFITSAVIRSSAALVPLRYCERQASDDFFAVLVSILIGVIDLSVLAL